MYESSLVEDRATAIISQYLRDIVAFIAKNAALFFTNEYVE